jgi:hypothetical protein
MGEAIFSSIPNSKVIISVLLAPHAVVTTAFPAKGVPGLQQQHYACSSSTTCLQQHHMLPLPSPNQALLGC